MNKNAEITLEFKLPIYKSVIKQILNLGLYKIIQSLRRKYEDAI